MLTDSLRLPSGSSHDGAPLNGRGFSSFRGLNTALKVEITSSSDAQMNFQSFQNIEAAREQTFTSIVETLQKTSNYNFRSSNNVSGLSLSTISDRSRSTVLSSSEQSRSSIHKGLSSPYVADSTTPPGLSTASSSDIRQKTPELDSSYEAERIAALYRYGMLDTDNEASYDNLADVTAHALAMPICLITMIDKTRVWFKARHGCTSREVPREIAFCNYFTRCTTTSTDSLVVQDTLKDPRFASNPLVTGHQKFRFYAGVPILSFDGYVLGALNVLDTKPRHVRPYQIEMMQKLARQAESEIELRMNILKLQDQMLLTERLLSNILPPSIIERLKSIDTRESNELVIADSFECATIIFVDIVGFTQYASGVSASALVQTLGALFSRFDRLTVKHNITKIKTVGDGYLCVGGIPEITSKHATSVVSFALELLDVLSDFNDEFQESFEVRIGINSGPVTAGVVGTEKFTYDCFGDAVNVASRIESWGLPGRVHISETTYQLVKGSFDCEKRTDLISLKGKQGSRTCDLKLMTSSREKVYEMDAPPKSPSYKERFQLLNIPHTLPLPQPFGTLKAIIQNLQDETTTTIPIQRVTIRSSMYSLETDLENLLNTAASDTMTKSVSFSGSNSLAHSTLAIPNMSQPQLRPLSKLSETYALSLSTPLSQMSDKSASTDTEVSQITAGGGSVFDTVIKLATRIFNVSIAFVALEDDPLFVPGCPETGPDSPSLSSNRVMVVEDAQSDDRYMHNPLVTKEPSLRFFAKTYMYGTDGTPLGVLCIGDKKPGTFTSKQKSALSLLARQTENEMQLKAAVAKIQDQMALTTRLLSNILPAGIIERLKTRDVTKQELVLADSYDSATVVFSDIVNFTRYAATVSPQNLVQTLGKLFSKFDNLTVKHGITKLKTIGDGYMAVCGVPVSNAIHAEQAIDFALDMFKALNDFNMENNEAFEMRIGINSGPLTAGVVGTEKFTFDCFGDTVNMASRMESTGVPGRIHISKATHDLVCQKFECVKLDHLLSIKGKSEDVQTYFALGQK